MKKPSLDSFAPSRTCFVVVIDLFTYAYYSRYTIFVKAQRHRILYTLQMSKIKTPLPGAEAVKESLKVFDAISLDSANAHKLEMRDVQIPKQKKQWFNELDPLLLSIVLVCGVLLATILIQVIIVLAKFPAEEDGDVSISQSAKTITEAQVKIANASESQVEEFKTLNGKMLEIERDLYKAKLDIEWLQARSKKQKRSSRVLRPSFGSPLTGNVRADPT